MKVKICIILGVLISLTINSQNDSTSNETPITKRDLMGSAKSGYHSVKLESIDDFTQVFFRDVDERIMIIHSNDSAKQFFDNYLGFAREVIEKYIKDKSYKKKYTDVVPFNPLYLRYNFVFNKNKILNLKTSKYQFLEKIKLLVLPEGTDYELFSKEFIDQLNEKLNNYSVSREDHLIQYELPLLVFVCHYILDKHNGELVIREAENDFNDSFYVPDVIVDGVELNLNKRLFRYLYHPDMNIDNKNVDIGAFLYMLDFLINGKITIKKM